MSTPANNQDSFFASSDRNAQRMLYHLLIAAGKNTRLKVFLGFLTALLLLALVGIVSYRSTQHLIETQRWVAHTYQVRDKIHATLLAVNDTRVDGHRFRIIPLSPEIDALQRLTADNPQQQKYVSALQRSVQPGVSKETAGRILILGRMLQLEEQLLIFRQE